MHQQPWSLQWHHNECNGISNHQPHDYLLNQLFKHRSKKTSKLHVTGLCEGNSPVTAQRASNADNVSIWQRHHDVGVWDTYKTWEYSKLPLRCQMLEHHQTNGVYWYFMQNSTIKSDSACKLKYFTPTAMVYSNKIWWLCLVPTSNTRFASDVGYRMAKNLIGLYKEQFFMNNDI